MKKLVKKLLFHTGLTTLYHLVRNRDTLTVLMLHRVLPLELQIEYGANPEWSMTPEVFQEFMKFLKRYYNPVSVEQVEQQVINGKPLPNRAILVTFDDGWRDNYQYASQILTEMQMPAIIFIVSNAIDQKYPFWQELIYSCCSISDEKLAECISLSRIQNCTDAMSLIQQLENSSDLQTAKSRVIQFCKEVKVGMPRQLISKEELAALSDRGMAIGSHGATHNQLAKMTRTNQFEELSLSKDILEKITSSEIRYLSFPHGSNNLDTIECCAKIGYKLMFNSRAAINKTKTSLISRMHISQKSIADDQNFSSFKSSFRLFFNPLS